MKNMKRNYNLNWKKRDTYVERIFRNAKHHYLSLKVTLIPQRYKIEWMWFLQITSHHHLNLSFYVKEIHEYKSLVCIFLPLSKMSNAPGSIVLTSSYFPHLSTNNWKPLKRHIIVFSADIYQSYNNVYLRNMTTILTCPNKRNKYSWVVLHQ